MRKVFLEGLPRRGNFIDWKNCAGFKVNFISDDAVGEIDIIEHYMHGKNSYLKIKYKNEILNMSANQFSDCRLEHMLGKRTRKYKYNIREIIEPRTGKIQILDHIRMYNHKGYKYKCLIDGYEGQMSERNLKDNQSCPVCTGLKALMGYSDLWTTHSELAKMLKYPERGYELSYGSGKSEIFICPNCKSERSYIIDNITKYGYTCLVCDDGISYPNKFVRNFLNQVNENYAPEYCPKWIGKQKYDNYLLNRNELWEVHGKQHYIESGAKDGRRTLDEEQENDKIKKELAEQNGYKYIEIDARYSEMEYIKNSLMSLSEIQRYDLNNVDWNKINEQSLKSLVKVACDYWVNGINNTKEIANIMKLARGTIVIYLKKGAELGWCTYNSIQEGLDKGKRTIVQLSESGELIRIWNSLIEAGREINKSLSCIGKVCRNQRKTAFGFKWMYKEDYDKLNSN